MIRKSPFHTLFAKGEAVDPNISEGSLINVCIGLMYNGNPPNTLPFPKPTRNTFLKAYKGTNGYVKQSREMVRASVIQDLREYYENEDYSELPEDVVEHFCTEVKDIGF